MAQRKEARIFVSIWDDPAFCGLPPGSQRMYLYLLSQIDLSYCGVISLRERRWARDAEGLTAAQVAEDLDRLANPFPGGIPEGLPGGAERPLIVIDEDAEELLVRSLVRNDGIWKIPNLLKSARESATLVKSPKIRAALADELRRIPAAESPSAQVRSILAGFIADLDPGPGNPSRKGSANPSPNPSGNPGVNPPQSPSGDPARRGADHGQNGHGYPQARREPDEAEESPPVGTGSDGEAIAAGQERDRNPLANPSAKGSANPSVDPSQGKGVKVGDTGTPIPGNPFAPSPVRVAEEVSQSARERVQAQAREAEAVCWLSENYGLTDQQASTAWAVAEDRAPTKIRNPVKYLKGMVEDGSLARIVEAIQKDAARPSQKPDLQLIEGRARLDGVKACRLCDANGMTHEDNPRRCDHKPPERGTQSPLLQPVDEPDDTDDSELPAADERAAARAQFDRVNATRNLRKHAT